MKKILKLSLLVSSLIFTGCTPVESTSSSSDESSSSSSSTSELTWVDYVKEGNCKLDLDYHGRSFFEDGIAQVTLKTHIDGDTVHFKDSDGESIIKSRFYGIDTPESTGKVQPWGKAASNYTKEKITAAEKNGTIVVSSPNHDYGKPSPDSTGARYVSLIWINTEKKDAPLDELYLLNLWIVQDGFSNVKNVLDMPEYKDTFYNAEEQARAFKLNMFSGEDDPNFNYGGYIDMDLLSIKREVEAQIKDPSHENAFDNANLRVQGTVSGFSNNILYIQNFYTFEEGALTEAGEYAGLNIFVGMSSIPSKYTKINTYIEVCGVCSDSENFGFQMSGAKFSIVPVSDDDARVIIKAEDNTEEHKLKTFEYTPDQLQTVINDTNCESLYSQVKITEKLKVTGTYSSDDGNEITLKFGSYTFQAYVAFKYKGDSSKPNWIWTEEDFVGKEFMITSVLSIHKASNGKYYFQLCPSSNSDLVWLNPGA